MIGAAQLALLVATGGYQPLHWGLFALIAAAGQWLAWRNRDLAVVPTLGAALSVLLLLLWPAPPPAWFAANRPVARRDPCPAVARQALA